MKGRNQSTEMGKSMVAMLWLWVLLSLYIKNDLKVEAKASSQSEREIEAKLKLLNKPAVKSIKSEDGDIIDCVDIYKQPAFDHPALKNHKIKIPDFIRESHNSSIKSEREIFQTWQKSGSCPEGTVPIRRIRKEDLLRAESLDRFGRKPPAVFKNSTATNITDLIPNSVFIPENRSAAYLVTLGYNFIGAQADINVWNPNIDLPNDFTTAQIWLKSANGPNFESVESGWVVNPKLYGDRATRFFIYWTKDSYQSTGCFDVTCRGFVMTGTQVALGASITPISSRRGPQYEINVAIDWNNGNWYLKVKNDIPVGYWPKELFGGLSHSASLVEWGGQVSSEKIKKEAPPHTGTQMGSGNSASGQYGGACFMRNIRIRDYSLQLKYPSIISTTAEEPYCYNTLNVVKVGVEPMFYFGGPGRNPPYCP